MIIFLSDTDRFTALTKAEIIKRNEMNPSIVAWVDKERSPGDIYDGEGFQIAAFELINSSPELTSERKVFLSDIMCTAVEGGIDYWAVIQKVTKENWSETYSDYISFEVAEYLHKNKSELEWHQVDFNTIELGIKRLVDRDIKCAYLGNILLGNAENDAGGIDVEGADCILQAAIFNEIRYG